MSNVKIINDATRTKDITPEMLVQAATDFDARKTDVIVDVGEGVSINKQVAWGGVGPTDLTGNALTLLGMKLGNRTADGVRLPVDWMRKAATAHEFDTILNTRFGMVKADGGWNYMARYYNGDGAEPSAIRAVLGADYPAFGAEGVYENTIMVKALANALKTFEGNWEFRRCELTPDSVSVRVFTRSFAPEQINSKHKSSWAIGWVLRNNETGEGGFGIHAAIQRHACKNSVVMLKDGGAKYSHIGAKVKFTTAIEQAMSALMSDSMSALRAVSIAETTPINFAAELDALERKFGWTDRKGNFQTEKAKELHDAVLIGTEGDTSTLMGLINGVTFAAHRVDQNESDQLAMELFGGALLERVIERDK